MFLSREAHSVWSVLWHNYQGRSSEDSLFSGENVQKPDSILRRSQQLLSTDRQQSHINCSISHITEQPPATIIWAWEGECVCVSCIIVGLQMYVCIQSAHCKTVVRCWFTCKSVIEKENRCKPLRLALGTKLLFRVKLRVLLVLNSTFEVIFGKGLCSTTYSSFIYFFAFIDRKVQRPGRQWSPFSPCRSLQHTSRLLNHVSYSNALDTNFIRCKTI